MFIYFPTMTLAATCFCRFNKELKLGAKAVRWLEPHIGSQEPLTFL
jgi:hypothetical protein